MEQNTSLIYLSYLDLILGFSLILIAAGLSKWKELKLEKDLIIASIRTFLQLIGVGFILKYVFESNNSILVLLFIFLMLTVAVFTVIRDKESIFSNLSIIISFALISSSGITVFIVTQIIINIDPWYSPQYLIPIAGMVIGNSINGASIAIDRLDSELREKKDKIEALLCLGAKSEQSCADIIRSSMLASLIPTINSMMIVGIVTFPGIMTGQILSGISPISAIKYQIIIMYMIAFSVTICSYLIINLRYKSYFSKDHQYLHE